MLRYLIHALLWCTPALLSAQTTIRVMSYNLLVFPEPVPAGREDTLRKILQHHPIDLLLVQELRSQTGADLILDHALNQGGTTRFSQATYITQQSAPFTTVKLTQHLYFDHELFTLKRQQTLLTAVRDLNVYTLYLNDDDLSVSQDTTFLVVCVVHLKAGTGVVNEYDREQMALVLKNHLATLPADSRVIIAGDMNLYGAQEAAYQALLANSGGPSIQDPLTLPVQWNENQAMAQHHTQSTRTSPLFGEGAGGGLDDRFDVALLSQALMNGSGALQLVPGSYKALGNSGTCFNGNITWCSSFQTPAGVLSALHHMSDHLPVVFNLSYSRAITGITPRSLPNTLELVPGPTGVAIRAEQPGNGALRMWDMTGRILLDRDIHWSVGITPVALPLEGRQGVWCVSLTSPDQQTTLRIATIP